MIQVDHSAVWTPVSHLQISNCTKVAIYHHLQGCPQPPHCKYTVLARAPQACIIESTQSYINQLEFNYIIDCL